ncbi:exo-alpha-sialidase [bacterium]|nr:exo-alpha-sialidase [bacterium]
MRGPRAKAAALVSALVFAGIASAAGGNAKPALPRGARTAHVAVSPDGKSVFVLGASDAAIQVAVSPDGKKFGAPVTVAKFEGKLAPTSKGPQIAATCSSVVVATVKKDPERAERGTGGRGESGTLLSYTSRDGGKTWRPPVRVTGENAGSLKRELYGLAAGPDDEVACVWLDDRSGSGEEVYLAVSRDGGATWGEEKALYRSPGGSVSDFAAPAVAWNARGQLAVVFRNLLEESTRDVWIVGSNDRGKTFAPPAKLGKGTFQHKGSVSDGGSVAGGADGSFDTAWLREGEVFLCSPGKKEQSLGHGVRPQVAQGPTGPHVVWLLSTVDMGKGGTENNEIVALAPGAGQPKTLGAGKTVRSPSLASSLDGKGPVVCVWASDDDGVLASVVAPRGK